MPLAPARLQHAIVQRYISNPLLMSGHKFDLRVFVTVASLSPLRVFVHHHGWANVADTPFTQDVLTSHVTNAAFMEHKRKEEVAHRMPLYVCSCPASMVISVCCVLC